MPSLDRGRTPVHCPGLPARRFRFALNDGTGGSQLTIGDCFITTKHVEVEIECLARRGEPKKMLLSTRPNHHEQTSVLDIGPDVPIDRGNYPYTSVVGLFFDWFTDMIPTKSREFASGHALAGAIADPTNPFRYYNSDEDSDEDSDEASLKSVTDISRNVNSLEFSERFAQFMNTFWITLIGCRLITGSVDVFTAERALNATGTIINDEEFVACHRGWLLAFTIATGIALLCAIASLCLTLLRKWPRLSWDVSTAGRDNLYVLVPGVESYLDDNERSRIMSQKTVMLGDVKPEGEVGYIAIASVGTNGMGGPQRLQKGRLYS